MFYDIFESLAKENGYNSANAAAAAIGLSNSKTTKWKKGAMPQGETLAKIADFFNVSTDYLQGRTNEKKPPAYAEDIKDELIK